MLDPQYQWLLEGMFPPPRMLNSALFLDTLPAADWLREVCVDAGKLFVIVAPEQIAGGRIAVSDIALVADYDPMIHFERPRPELSDGARRLKLNKLFDPALVGDPFDVGVCGDIVLCDGKAGVLIGDDGSSAHVLLAGLAVEKWPLADCSFRHPPQTHGSDFMARFALRPDGTLNRAAMNWLLGEEEPDR
ncbi:hypothetical protein EAO27_13435 [Sphingopyxis sp. YF1]|uniref:hypothetical protein n=1 Tax=Sphingopyxis sp. YF1 TaxID=2482763 RepID=UPI001F600AEA|nr:hypothetical protein [Sphingopyxis sp. YF1]UNU43611.1 hypothetical protein EAO27_13435 [Sphingopyxis sp. YF1]